MQHNEPVHFPRQPDAVPATHVIDERRQQAAPVHLRSVPVHQVEVPSTHCEYALVTQQRLPVHSSSVPVHHVDVPATHWR